MQNINLRIVLFLMGILLLFNGAFMLMAAGVSYFYQEDVVVEITFAAFSVLSLGALAVLVFRKHETKIQKREGYLIVTLGWFLMALSGLLPYWISGAIPSFSASFFETMSGYTTTGATILNDIEALPKGLLFWRSMTHWIGGMGIIVLAIAILPFLGIGGFQLFTAEVPGLSSDKLHPKIADTAKRLWLIYLGLTLLETLLLTAAGMSFFDAINHAMSTLSTGGFSTKNASIAFWNNNPTIQYIIIFFMFLAGTNFVLSYFAIKGKISKVLQDDEFRWYSFFVITFGLLVAALIYFNADLSKSSIAHPQLLGPLESVLRHGLFQVVAIITTTGFVTADYTLWMPFLTIVFFGLMFLGGSSGSTSGGVKVVRHLLMIRGGLLEFKRAIHPNAIIQARYNNKIVDDSISYNILGFFILYLLSFIIGALGFGFMGIDFESAVGVAASTLGNVGPALGHFGPTQNYELLTEAGQWWASFLMLLGRLELFTVLILFTPFFWKKT